TLFRSAPSRAASRPRRGAPWAMVRTSRPTPEPRAPDAHPVLDPGRAGAHRADVVHPYAALQAVADAAVEAPRRACALVVTQHPFARGEECGGDALALEGDELPAFEAEAHLAAAQCGQQRMVGDPHALLLLHELTERHRVDG